MGGQSSKSFVQGGIASAAGNLASRASGRERGAWESVVRGGAAAANPGLAAADFSLDVAEVVATAIGKDAENMEAAAQKCREQGGSKADQEIAKVKSTMLLDSDEKAEAFEAITFLDKLQQLEDL